MDPISLIAGAGIATVFGLAGHISGRVTARSKRPASQAEPICGCRHHRAQHDPASSQCHQLINIALRGYTPQFRQCTCRQYVGPEPMPSYQDAMRMLEEGSER